MIFFLQRGNAGTHGVVKDWAKFESGFQPDMTRDDVEDLHLILPFSPGVGKT